MNRLTALLPLWLNKRRAEASPPRAIYDNMRCWRSRCPGRAWRTCTRISKTTEKGKGLGLDRINPRGLLQPSKDLRERFIDIVLAFEANPPKTFQRVTHTWCNGPKTGEMHRTIVPTVSLSPVLSRLRRSLAQQWESEHNADFFFGVAKGSLATARLGHTP